jgi:hypothetical protein
MACIVWLTSQQYICKESPLQRGSHAVR